MSYQVLARKWRPQNFKEMVGQQHVLRALINALEDDRLHHAYLFTGTRGVGKTTIARILAKCLNCETGVTSEPCGECSSCKEIVAGNFVDLIEVDAASRTKVEDTRELLDNVQYAPTRGRFKVYLIDEVHMLTGHSFNALLKTLEEPPPHVKFLFATTDPQKLPVTILSRCLQFNLKRMPVELISGHLKYLTEQESISSDEASLKLIARAADGSMRDALSLLDQSIAYGQGELQETDVREMLGTISHEPLVALLKTISAGDGQSLIQQIEELAGITPDFEAATDAMIALLHQVAVQQVVPDAIQEDDSITELATLLSKEDVQLYYQIALHGRRDLPLSPDPKSGFEMIMLRMLSFRPLQEGMTVQDQAEPTSKKKTINLDQQSTQKQVSQSKTILSDAKEPLANQEPSAEQRPLANKGLVSKKPSKNTENRAYKPKTVSNNPVTKINQIEETPPWETLPETLSAEDPAPKSPASLTKADPQQHKKQISKASAWHLVVPELSLSGRAAELIKHCLLESKENGIIHLSLDQSSEGLLADSIKREIQSALSQFYGEAIDLKLEVAVVETNNTFDSANETPAQRTARNETEIQQQAEQNIAADPFVIELQNRFGAQIVSGSVKSKVSNN